MSTFDSDVHSPVTKIADAASADWQRMADHYGVENSESVGDTGLDNPILIHVRIERWISYDEAG